MSRDSCLGQLDLLYSGLSSESNPLSRPIFRYLPIPCRICDSFSATRLTLFSSSSGVKSRIQFRTAASPLSRYRVPASRQPALPYQARGRSQLPSISIPAPPRRPRILITCRRVSERAGPEASLVVVGVLSGRPLLGVSSLSRPAPLKAQRTLRVRFVGVKSSRL